MTIDADENNVSNQASIISHIVTMRLLAEIVSLCTTTRVPMYTVVPCIQQLVANVHCDSLHCALLNITCVRYRTSTDVRFRVITHSPA